MPSQRQIQSQHHVTLLAPAFPALVILLAFVALPAAALEPDEILLVVNRNVPESSKLAEFYRTARSIPDIRTIALDLPRTEQMGFGLYERQAVFPIRQFLRKNNLQNKIKCVVTFFGVPLRLAPKTATPDEIAETAQLQAEYLKRIALLRQTVADTEAKAASYDTQFKPGQSDDLPALAARAQAALETIAKSVPSTNPQSANQRLLTLAQAVRQLRGRAGLVAMIPGPDNGAVPGEDDSITWKDLRNRSAQTATEMTLLQDRLFDPAVRTRLRNIVTDTFGLLEITRLLQVLSEYLAPGTTPTAFDSELALLWWDSHPRNGAQLNRLHYRLPQGPGLPPTLMVMRLDAPQSGQVREIILSSLKAEQDGLKGKIVLDSRGIRARPDNLQLGGYAWYDQSIRNLAELLRTKTRLPLLIDESPQVLQPGSATDVALYCGWYSVRNYIPSCRFNAGAVAFHVASFELASLKNPNEKGWCAGLLNDGVAATLGPVAEPYLTAFPLADEFFPLLLTGKLCLADVYWRTATTTGWMISMIGDPLYRPYHANPPLRINDLPDRLQTIFSTPTTRASTAKPH